MKFSIITAALGLIIPAGASAAINFIRAAGHLESAMAVWQPVEGAASYDAVATPVGGGATVTAHTPLVRQYPDGIRVDIPGLPAGAYTITVTARDAAGGVVDSGTTTGLNVSAHVREGFAFIGGVEPGAYKADGSLKEGASVLYIYPATVNTVTLDVIKDKKGTTQSVTGLAAILEARSKGFDKTPLSVRFIGTVADTQFEGLKDGNYINLQGNNNTDRMLENITLEGIGDDATLYGYGVCFKRTSAIEVRNLGIMLFGDDAISFDTDNNHVWIHNVDFFYGRPGSDADQVKGDGSVDIKYRSTDLTISACHFFDSGKVMGCGGTTGEEENLRISYHHNWFDHADSRCPRLHYITAHVYNNYYDGVPVYCIGNTTETSAYVENNYFRAVKRPMMISGQGTDTYDEAKGTYTLKGTFSGQAGGMTKAYGNLFVDSPSMKLVYYTDNPVQFDAYLASERGEQVPATVVSYKGAWPYNNFDTAPGMYAWTPDAAADVPAIVTAIAGRTEGGDFKWNFDNAKDDEDHSVNVPLKSAVTSYQSRLVAIQGEEGFGSQTAIGTIAVDPSLPVAVYDLNGRRVTDSMDALPAGIYIVRQGGNAVKIVRH